MADGLVITGPTASGKTALSVDVARRLAGEIISFDSRQVYARMDIGTAKPSAAERAGVRHFGFDIVQPGERYSAGRFAADARHWISEITARGHVPVLVGGTGFFLRALTHPLFDEPQLDSNRKEALKAYLSSFSREELLAWLQRLDEVNAQRLASEGGRHRIARAIEVALLTGRRLSEWHDKQQPQQPLQFVTIVLTMPRDELYHRINARVDEMLRTGLIEEVRALLEAGYDETASGMDATGYREIVQLLGGQLTLEAAVEAIKAASRQYARRQETWLRHQLPDDVVRLDATKPRQQLVDEVIEAWNARAA
jgi:tRNA dimethylallyltransferase